MNVVLPAYIPESREALRAWMQSVTYAKLVQIDLVDGVFASPPSWPFSQDGELSFEEIDVTRVMLDLMVDNGAVFVAAHAAALRDVREIVIHLRSLTAVDELAHVRAHIPGKLTLAVLNTDPFSAYREAVGYVDAVQVMGIATIGRQGQVFDPETLQTVRQLRAAFPKLDIVVDGSVNESTIAALVAAGVSRVVVGSALQKHGDPAQAYRHLTAYFAGLQ